MVDDWSELDYKARERVRKNLSVKGWKSRQNGKRKEYDKKYEQSTRKRPYRSGEFIAVDGEGSNSCNSDTPCGQEVVLNPRIRYTNHKPGCQKYILLMNSEGEMVSDVNGLSTVDCLDFLCRMKEAHPDCIFVIFGGSYDANMILKDLPYESILILQKKKRVYYKNYRIAYVPRKYFQVSEYEKWHGDKRKRVPIHTVTLWDVIGFFQGSFVSSLEKYFTDQTDRRCLLIDEIKQGKARRSQFTQSELENFIIPYTEKEVAALVNLMEKLRDNMVEAGIRVNRWDGAGAAAAALLRSYGVKKYYAELPRDVEQAAQVAYGGGRIEILQYGHTDEQIFHYDLVGAYPSVMPLLPQLSGGTWSHVTSAEEGLFEIEPYCLYKVSWDYKHKYSRDGQRISFDNDNVLYPFFYREPWGDPRVFYPHSGFSWVWSPELEIALKWQHKLKGKIIFYEKYKFTPSTDYRPFAFVRDLYLKRLEFKRKGMGAELALKLAINSFYGKTAQTVGYQHGDGLRRPPFHNLAYAGLITSWTRSRMFDAAMQNPESVVAIATDGIWATEPLHPPWGNLEIGKNLGQWEFEILESMTSVQAGVYFATNEKGEQTHHYRGFNEGSITEQDVLEAWKRGERWMVIPTSRFTTMGSAIASEGRFEDNWRVWDNRPRTLTIVPGGKSKRMAVQDTHEIQNACEGLIPLCASHSMYYEEEITHRGKTLTDYFLSSRHPLPWDFYELGREEERQEIEWIIDREVIESDV